MTIAAAVTAAETKLGPLDGLVNCASIVIYADPLETARTDLERIFRVNLFGAYESWRLVARPMIDSGARGAIVSVASEAGSKGRVAYSASTAALINMTSPLRGARPARHQRQLRLSRGVATDLLRKVGGGYGKLWSGRPLSAACQFAVGQTYRASRGRADDLLPPKRPRHYHAGASR